MSKRLFAALFSISVIVAPVMSQTQPKDQQDAQKEKRMEYLHLTVIEWKKYLKLKCRR